MNKRRFVGLISVLMLLTPVAVLAEAVIQSYSSDSPLEKGRIVAVVDKNTKKVEPAAANQLDKMYGVVVDANDAPVTLTLEGQRVFVATSGKYEVLVSAENGPITVGAYISMAASSGIGAKATNKQTYVLGKAMEGFDGKSNVISSAGGVNLGRILVDIQASKNPTLQADNNFLPSFLQKSAESLAGKPVPPARIYAGIAIVLVTGFLAGSLLYAGVRNAIISIGRNPLGKKGIIRGLMQVVIISLIIFITGLFGVYLLVKL